MPVSKRGISASFGTTASSVAFHVLTTENSSRAVHCGTAGGSLPCQTPTGKIIHDLWLTENANEIVIHSGDMPVAKQPWYAFIEQGIG